MWFDFNPCEFHLLTKPSLPQQNRNGRPLHVIMLREGVQQHMFGSSLQTVELEWLVQEIQSHLGLQEDLTMRTSITSSNLSPYFEESDFQDEWILFWD